MNAPIQDPDSIERVLRAMKLPFDAPELDLCVLRLVVSLEPRHPSAKPGVFGVSRPDARLTECGDDHALRAELATLLASGISILKNGDGTCGWWRL